MASDPVLDHAPREGVRTFTPRWRNSPLTDERMATLLPARSLPEGPLGRRRGVRAGRAGRASRSARATAPPPSPTAPAHPEADLVAVEVHVPGVARMLAAAEEAGVTNLWVHPGDAMPLPHRPGARAVAGGGAPVLPRPLAEEQAREAAVRAAAHPRPAGLPAGARAGCCGSPPTSPRMPRTPGRSWPTTAGGTSSRASGPTGARTTGSRPRACAPDAPSPSSPAPCAPPDADVDRPSDAQGARMRAPWHHRSPGSPRGPTSARRSVVGLRHASGHERSGASRAPGPSDPSDDVVRARYLVRRGAPGGRSAPAGGRAPMWTTARWPQPHRADRHRVCSPPRPTAGVRSWESGRVPRTTGRAALHARRAHRLHRPTWSRCRGVAPGHRRRPGRWSALEAPEALAGDEPHASGRTGGCARVRPPCVAATRRVHRPGRRRWWRPMSRRRCTRRPRQPVSSAALGSVTSIVRADDAGCPAASRAVTPSRSGAHGRPEGLHARRCADRTAATEDARCADTGAWHQRPDVASDGRRPGARDRRRSRRWATPPWIGRPRRGCCRPWLTGDAGIAAVDRGIGQTVSCPGGSLRTGRCRSERLPALPGARRSLRLCSTGASRHRRCRGSRIRTGGLPLPKRTRYQAAPYPAAARTGIRHRRGRAKDFGSRERGPRLALPSGCELTRCAGVAQW